MSKVRYTILDNGMGDFVVKEKTRTHTGVRWITLENTIDSFDSLEKAKEARFKRNKKLLKKDNLCGLFPEGQRSRDGKMGQAKLGVAIMALKSGSPIIPLAIKGTFEAFPRKTKFIKPANVILKFGEPIRYDIEKKPSKERINNVKDEIMSKIQSLYNEIS